MFLGEEITKFFLSSNEFFKSKLKENEELFVYPADIFIEKELYLSPDSISNDLKKAEKMLDLLSTKIEEIIPETRVSFSFSNFNKLIENILPKIKNFSLLFNQLNYDFFIQSFGEKMPYQKIKFTKEEIKRKDHIRYLENLFQVEKAVISIAFSATFVPNEEEYAKVIGMFYFQISADYEVSLYI